MEAANQSEAFVQLSAAGYSETGAGYSTRNEVPDPRRKFLGQVLGRRVRERPDPLPRVWGSG